jgi:2-keto-3-deoxy-L-arabinonate dehydratase
MAKRYPFFKGMTPILPTVIDENGDPDLKAQGRIVEYVLSCGAVAIGHMAGASEYYKVSEYDRDTIIRSLTEQVAGRVPVFIGTTDVARKTALKQAEQAEAQGASLIMVCSPITGAMSRDDLMKYYEDVGKASSLPMILQDTGASSGLYSADFIEEACERVPTLGYVKSEGINCLPKAKKLIADIGDRVQIIGGNGGYAMPTLLRLGVTAFMTGTECTDVHNDVIQAYFAGDEKKADMLYHMTIMPYLYFFSHANRYFLKYMLKRRGIIDNVYLPFPDEKGVPDPFIIDEMDRTLDRINEFRCKKVL